MDAQLKDAMVKLLEKFWASETNTPKERITAWFILANRVCPDDAVNILSEWAQSEPEHCDEVVAALIDIVMSD